MKKWYHSLMFVHFSISKLSPTFWFVNIYREKTKEKVNKEKKDRPDRK